MFSYVFFSSTNFKKFTLCYLDSKDLEDFQGAFFIDLDSFDKGLLFDPENTVQLEELMHHPVFLIFGLLNSLNHKYGDARKEKLF